MAVRFDALNRLIDTIRQSNHDFRETTDIFPSLDVEKLARNLDLYALAEENGKQGKPSQSAKSLDDVEQKIVAEIEEEKKGAFQLLSDQYQTFSDRLRGLDLEGKFGLIRKSNVSSLSEFTAEVVKGSNELHALGPLAQHSRSNIF